ncbi:MAG: 50S ribosomal protein L32 [bacterium]|jgi:large subunit ribosomal protein L32|nr:50S ribosomal protein L32 [bacterium]MDD3805945.1 50S ribosomal protein L32 [bacterium]MDD4558098.1 50S ribosomal protein L32 [bacterium]
MALPKYRTSKARRDKRRTHWKISATNVVHCSKCKTAKLPHTVCGNCGFYGGREAVTVAAAE